MVHVAEKVAHTWVCKMQPLKPGRAYTWQCKIVEGMAPALLKDKRRQGCIAKSRRSERHTLHTTLRCFTAVQLMQQAQGAQLGHCSTQRMPCNTRSAPIAHNPIASGTQVE